MGVDLLVVTLPRVLVNTTVMLDEVAPKLLIQKGRTEIFSNRCADNSAVIGIILDNARVGIDLRCIVNGRQIISCQTVDLKRIDQIYRQRQRKKDAEQKPYA